MTDSCDWLPALVLLEQYGRDWGKYIEGVYGYFKKDFVESKPRFENRDVGLKRYPFYQNKESAFWHLTSEGEVQENRLPDMRRCERIRWPRPVIEHCLHKSIRCWRNKRGQEKRIVLWFFENDYVVILADRGTYVLLWTAYPVTYNHTREKLQKEFEESLKG